MDDGRDIFGVFLSHCVMRDLSILKWSNDSNDLDALVVPLF